MLNIRDDVNCNFNTIFHLVAHPSLSLSRFEINKDAIYGSQPQQKKKVKKTKKSFLFDCPRLQPEKIQFRSKKNFICLRKKKSKMRKKKIPSGIFFFISTLYLCVITTCCDLPICIYDVYLLFLQTFMLFWLNEVHVHG